MIGKTNLKVLLYDSDFYGRYAINSYLAWDRRTRVVYIAKSAEDIFAWLKEHIEAEWPDVVVLDTYTSPTPEHLREFIHHLRKVIPDILIVLLDRDPRLEYALAAIETESGAYFLRNDVGMQIAWAIVWAQRPEFAVSIGVTDILTAEVDPRLSNAVVLPPKRHYPELTDRIRQAIQLCVVEGMSADLAADEMGVSPHTIRSYVKEGYRILESYDEMQEYPPEMSAQERAYMRFTALDPTATHDAVDDSDEQPAETEG